MRPLICTLLLLCTCVPAFTEDAPKDKPAQAGKDAAAAKDEISISEINAKGIADLKNIGTRFGGTLTEALTAVGTPASKKVAALAAQNAKKKKGKNYAPAIKQDGANQVSIIASTTERRAAIEFAEALAMRPQLAGAASRQRSQSMQSLVT